MKIDRSSPIPPKRRRSKKSTFFFCLLPTIIIFNLSNNFNMKKQLLFFFINIPILAQAHVLVNKNLFKLTPDPVVIDGIVIDGIADNLHDKTYQSMTSAGTNKPMPLPAMPECHQLPPTKHLFNTLEEAAEYGFTHQVARKGYIDLASFVELHYSEDDVNTDIIMSPELFLQLGLSYQWSIVDYLDEGQNTHESAHFQQDNEIPSIFYPRSVDEDGNTILDKRATKEAIGHNPIVKVELVKNGEVLCCGFIKINITTDSYLLMDNHIMFRDIDVMDLCVDNWDTDKNRMISYEEAASVTDLGEVFADNHDIISFDELQFFTGLTAINENAFMSCSKLATITLPEGITSISSYAFYGCKALTTFTIPQSVIIIGTNTFRGCSGLTDVYCMPLEVPTTAANAFNNSNIGNATLHVVSTSFDAYKDVSPWNNFKNMLGDIPTPCAPPVISYIEGKLLFTCNTEGVEFKSNIYSADFGDHNDEEIDLCTTYDISVYATKEGSCFPRPFASNFKLS